MPVRLAKFAGSSLANESLEVGYRSQHVSLLARSWLQRNPASLTPGIPVPRLAKLSSERGP
jgi:hypothetical protein